jgi:diguanylate cyclase (GGDEF)-like protein
VDGRSPTSIAIRFTQRLVLGSLAEENLARARRVSCLVLLAVFAPLGFLSSFAVRGLVLTPAAVAGTVVTTLIVVLAWTTRTDAQQHRWWWVVLLIAIDQSIGIYQLDDHGVVLLAQTTGLGVWCALYMPTRIVRHAVVCISLTIMIAIVGAPDRLIALLAVAIAQAAIVAVTVFTHSAVLTLRSTNADLDEARALAQTLARTDVLTGTANRRSFTDLVQTLVEGPQASYALLLVDVDHFKSLNDQHGHLVGDEVLCEIARRLSIAMAGETVARWGGEEFVALCASDASEVGARGDLLRATVAGVPIATTAGPLRVTVSVGATTWRAPESFDDALRRADLGLYDAKALGRNRCVVRAACDGAGTVATDDVRRPA